MQSSRVSLITGFVLFISLTQQGYATANSCDNSNNDIFAQLIHIVNGNQNLTQHVLDLSDRFHNLEMKLVKYADNFKKIEHLMREEHTKSKRHTETVVADTTNDDWTVIQRRKDGSENFYRGWNDYKKGFGSEDAEFFIGLEALHQMTTRRPYELMIVMEDWEGDRRYAKYSLFTIGSEDEKYALKQLGEYSGTAGDSLEYHRGQKFSTKDQENDQNDLEHCAVWYTGAWWYNACHRSNLNGRYLHGQLSQAEHAQGVHWNTFRGLYYSLKFVEMMIRPVRDEKDKSDESGESEVIVENPKSPWHNMRPAYG